MTMSSEDKIIEDLQDKIVQDCIQKITKEIEKIIQDGIDPLDAYDLVLKKIELDEEIIIIYELEGGKLKDFNLPNLDPKEIELLKKKIKDPLFNKYLKAHEQKMASADKILE